MNIERWQQINDIFQAAVELRPDERPAFLLDRCAGDDSLRLEIESLLAADDKASDFIETPALQATAKIMASSKPKLLFGQIIGHYEVLELIGKGGMGEVYAARDIKLGRKAAIKLLPSNLTTDKQRVRRFLKEARAISALNHPNIIVAYEIISEGDSHFIVTEFVEGETLRQVMARRRLTLDESLDITIQLAGALEAAHLAGIVHRDIKPENIMLRPDGYIKVLDFGLAKLTEQHSLNSKADAKSISTFDTDPGMIMGTIRYMSPEQAR
ncbi:MAG TPA: serine/threonine-protein kinase, partial [Blastocatellia bacterium]|nr:serine/threonine-protein kinase [Blastocatellia bacterium]